MVDIKLPICQGTYSTDHTNDINKVSFLVDVVQSINKHIGEYRPFFAGLCHLYIPDYECSLKRCSGCQLVSYCSRECQKADWSRHKVVCKEFPVVGGKNVLFTKGSWKKHIAGLRERATRIPNASSIFHNPRVCRICKETSQERLTDCKCRCVSYCSKKCSKDDKHHKNYCEDLFQISQIYALHDSPPLLPSLREITECDKFVPVYSWKDILPLEYVEAVQYFSSAELVLCNMQNSLMKERISYSMSLIYALQSLPGRRISSAGYPLEDLTTLDIHVITSIPLYDSELWEVFMHRLPNLKQLNITYVNQGRSFRQSFGLFMLSFGRCDGCNKKDRVITYSVHQMQYHMFYSSPEYTEPDVVVVYGNEHEMSSTGGDCIHKEISFRNMTHNRDTVLVLMDATKDQVIQGVSAVNAVQSVDEIVPPQMNPIKGTSTNRANIDSDIAIINEKSYFTCLRRK